MSLPEKILLLAAVIGVPEMARDIHRWLGARRHRG